MTYCIVMPYGKDDFSPNACTGLVHKASLPLMATLRRTLGASHIFGDIR